MVELKRTLDTNGHCVLEMPMGTGKTITLLSLITSYQMARKGTGKLVYCPRTVHEMEKALAELRLLHAYQQTALAGKPPPPPARGETAQGGKARAEFEAKDAERLKEEYQRLVDGLAQRGNLPARQSASDMRLANPLLPADILQEAMPGNIRHAEHFLAFLRRFLSYLQTRLNTTRVESEGPLAFMHALQAATGIESKSLQLCYDHLQSLVLTLQVAEVDEMGHVQCVCDIATLVGTYTRGFAIIIEPYDERQPQLADPVLQLSTSSPLRPTPHHPPCLQLSCLDASLAIRPTFERFQSVIITRSMLSPIDLYPRLLNSTPSASAPSPCRSRTTASARSSSHVAVSFLNLTNSVEPVGPAPTSDHLPLSTRFDMRSDPGVVRNYGRLLVDMAGCVPDGIVCFFVSYAYMDGIMNSWNDMGILKEVMEHKLVFIETQDVVETTLALDNYRRACDCGRGGVFFSIAR
ncbi:unnamed protein product [Closterium sp. Naga37s-1]|nr:unnamed protein product [Closterium sp. Naga37s-1]